MMSLLVVAPFDFASRDPIAWMREADQPDGVCGRGGLLAWRPAL